MKECPMCDGDGFFADDPMFEGYMAAPKYDCNYCKKTGNVSWVKWWYWEKIIETNSRWQIFEVLWDKLKPCKE